MLTAEELRELLSYDKITGIFIRKMKTSNCIHVGDIAGGLKSDGYLRIRIKGKRYLAHRLAWLYVHGSFPEQDIDHINGNKQDNSIANLRDVSCRENQCNRKRHREGRLQGCFYRKHTKKWIAQIRINGKKVHLGLFHTEAEAHEVYIQAKSQV